MIAMTRFVGAFIETDLSPGGDVESTATTTSFAANFYSFNRIECACCASKRKGYQRVLLASPISIAIAEIARDDDDNDEVDLFLFGYCAAAGRGGEARKRKREREAKRKRKKPPKCRCAV
jgi:hypothetical protein